MSGPQLNLGQTMTGPEAGLCCTVREQASDSTVSQGSVMVIEMTVDSFEKLTVNDR